MSRYGSVLTAPRLARLACSTCEEREAEGARAVKVERGSAWGQ